MLQTGNARDPKLPQTPTIYELMNDYRVPESGRRLARVVLSAALFGRPWVAPRGVPAERVEILREAFMQAARDPALLAEAETKDLGVVAAGGAELQKLAGEVITQPPEVVACMKRLVGEQ